MRTALLLVTVLTLVGCSQSPDLVRSQAVREQVFGRGIKDEAVLAALRAVPREAFLPADQHQDAYEDGPRTAAGGLVLPSPYLVGLVLSLARLQGDDRLLEVGTQTGYQAAVVAKMVAKVHSMDESRDTLAAAQQRWTDLAVENIDAQPGSVNDGWASAAPFDVILLWKAPSYVPTLLLNQLQLGGRMVIVHGALDAPKEIRVVEKQRDRSTTERVVVPTAK